MRRITTLLLLASSLALTVRAQEPSQPPAPTPPAPEPQAGAPPAETNAEGQPVFRTGINFVRVDALITDNKGNAVPNLSQEDFEVYEDNKLQTIESFKFVEVKGTPAEGDYPKQIRTTYDEEQELAQRFGIQGIPTMILFHHGKPIARQSGAMDASTIERWTRDALAQ